jgi:phage regulator Rha-like protein
MREKGKGEWEMKEIMPVERIEQRIFLIRGQKVMLDRDLAELYGVKTKVLNQAIKRNMRRFPSDFLFQLTEQEKHELVTNCDHLKELKHSYQLPYAFTEQGVAMLSSVLKSERAIEVNILIIRAFVRLRELLSTHKELISKFKELEQRVDKHDSRIIDIFDAIRKMVEPDVKPTKKIGFDV